MLFKYHHDYFTSVAALSDALTMEFILHQIFVYLGYNKIVARR